MDSYVTFKASVNMGAAIMFLVAIVSTIPMANAKKGIMIN